MEQRQTEDGELVAAIRLNSMYATPSVASADAGGDFSLLVLQIHVDLASPSHTVIGGAVGKTCFEEYSAIARDGNGGMQFVKFAAG